MRSVVLVSIFLGLAASGVRAEVVESTPSGFTSRNGVVVDATPREVWEVLVDEVAHWWSADHTFSGDAGNLSIGSSAGGCFCETLPGGGSVRHMTVIHAAPEKLLRMTGALGPLQAHAVNGTLSFGLEPVEEGRTRVKLDYAVSGHVAGGLEGWAEAVDRVVGSQLTNLANRFADPADPAAP